MVKANNKIVKCVLVCGILASLVSLSMGAMSKEEWDRARHNCLENKVKSACEALIDNGLLSVGQCNKESCSFLGSIYYNAGRYKESIPYLEKTIALGDNRGYGWLAIVYYELQDYYNAKKYYEIACNKGNGDSYCYNLGTMYYEGKGVRQDYHKAVELWKKACDMKFSWACNNIGFLYGNGLGVKQNLSTAKQYFGKACDLGEQMGCDNYRLLNNQGVQ